MDVDNHTIKLAGILYETYCRSVGGRAFNGDPLPSWNQFYADPKKTLQSNAWINVALEAIRSAGN